MATPTQNNRPPRGALIVIAVGLLATLAAAVLATDKNYGASAHLEWVQRAGVPSSAPAAVPGGDGREMQLIKGSIVATGTNVSGYELFRVANTLRIDAESPIAGASVLCATKAAPRTEIARSGEGLRALYPRSSESGIFSQGVPEDLVIDFSARGGENVIVEAEDLRILGFTTERGVKLEWPEYVEGTERLDYAITGKPKDDLLLPFYTIWKTTGIPSATVSCTLSNDSGEATVTTKAALKKASPPIDEEAEDEAEEQAEEEETEDEEAEGEE